MPSVLQHSAEYVAFKNRMDSQKTPDTGAIEEFLNQTQGYSKLDSLFRTDIDAQYDIVRIEEKDNKYPTGVAVIRDATAAKAIVKQKEDPAQFRVEANNTLLRALGRLRGIDHALQKMQEETQVDTTAFRNAMRKDFIHMAASLLKQAQVSQKEFESMPNQSQIIEKFNKTLKKAEKNFNTKTLCHVLHESGLDQGCRAKDCKELLFHYRNLAALIDPAKSLVTISHDKTNKVIYRIIQDPITEKSEEQVKAIREEMSQTTLFPTEGETNFQSTQKQAMQDANRYFADLAAQNDRMLGAQTRKTHLYGAKNAFYVTNELIFDAPTTLDRHALLDQAAKPEDRCHFLRGATPVYVGRGENKSRTEKAAEQNIEQVRQYVIKRQGLQENPDQVKIDLTCLITDSHREKQSTMLRTCETICSRPDSNTSLTHAPCNPQGTTQPIKPSSLSTLPPGKYLEPTRGNRAERYRNAGLLLANIIKRQIELVHAHAMTFLLVWITCASGQDRTGTSVAKLQQDFAGESYKKHGIAIPTSFDEKKGDIIEETLAISRNSAEMTTHMVGGSRGCKKDSKGNDIFGSDSLFSERTNDAMYLNSAKTNKENPINKKEHKKKMAEIPDLVRTQYLDASMDVNNTARALKKQNPELAAQGRVIVAAASESWKKIKPSLRGPFIVALKQANLVLQGAGPQNQDNEKYVRQVERLDTLAQGLRKKAPHTMRKYVNALRYLGGIALASTVVLIPLAIKVFKEAHQAEYQIKQEKGFIDSLSRLNTITKPKEKTMPEVEDDEEVNMVQNPLLAPNSPLRAQSFLGQNTPAKETTKAPTPKPKSPDENGPTNKI